MPAPNVLGKKRRVKPSTAPERFIERRRPGQGAVKPQTTEQSAVSVLPRRRPPQPPQVPANPRPSEKTAAAILSETFTQALQAMLEENQTRLQLLGAQLQLLAAVQMSQPSRPRGQAVGVVDLSAFRRELPGWYTPQLVTWKGVTLQVNAMAALQRASQMVGTPILGSGFRSHAEQVRLYQQKPELAAPPGYSYHEVGLAIDVNVSRLQALGLWERAKQAMYAVGFRQFDAQKEPWHFSYIVVG